MGRRRGMRPGEGRYEEHFWSKVMKDGATWPGMPTPCWDWLGSHSGDGYGSVRCDNRTQGAHRIAFWLATGREPVGWVLHKCDNPGCVNPGHLFEGDRAANMADMVAKGRQRGAAPENHPTRLYPERFPRGERQHSAKLTEEQVRAIRSSPETHYALAKKYGVNQSSIRKLRERRSWKHVA